MDRSHIHCSSSKIVNKKLGLTTFTKKNRVFYKIVMIKYVILIPSFNDWECLNLLIPKIDQALKNTNENVDVLIVNDGSTKKNNLVFKKIVSFKKN